MYAVVAFVTAATAVSLAAALTPPPARLIVGQPFQVSTASPGDASTDTMQLALLRFSVAAITLPSGVSTFREEATRLYWCDAGHANAQLSPNGAVDQVIVRLSGASNVTNATWSQPVLMGFGYSVAAAQLASTNPTLQPGVIAGDASLAVCGLLGFGAYNSTTAAATLPELELSFTWNVVDASYVGDIVIPRAGLGGSASAAIGPSSAITAEFDDTSIWCRAAGTNYFASTTRLEARITQQIPAMQFRFFDSWGNPALTSLADTASIQLSVVRPQLPLITTNQQSSVTVPAGSSFVAVPGCAIVGSSSPSELELAQRGVAKVLVRSALTMQRVAQGGRTFSTCGELYLLSGYPQALAIDPSPEWQSYTEISPSTSQPRYVVAVVPSKLAQGIIVRVTPTDSLGNPVVVPGGSLRPCTNENAAGCVLCGLPLSSTDLQMLVPVPQQLGNTSTAWFYLSPSAPDAVVDVVCWLQPGLDTGGRVIENVTSLSSASALQAWQSATVRSTATMRFQPIGQYSCYDGTTDFTAELSDVDLRNINKVFQNPNLEYIPFTTVSINLRGAAGSQQSFSRVGSDASADDAVIARTPLREWIVMPRPGFVNVPLGLMSVMAFGFTYSRTSSISVNLTRPVCDAASYAVMERAISAWLYKAGDNGTFYYEQANPTVDQANVVNIDLRVCYGAALETLDFVTAVCCNRDESCGTTDTKSWLSYLLLAGAAVVALATAIGTGWYINSVIKNTPVMLSTRYQIDIADKTRVVTAHLLAPWMLYAHMYFTFQLRTSSASALYWVDAGAIAWWGAAVLLRNFFPLYTLSKPFYMTAGTFLVCYQQFIVANAFIWMLAALSLNAAMLPFAAAMLLIMLQMFWSVLWVQEQLGPGLFTSEIPVHSIAPIDAALGVEYFAIVASLFLFAIGQIQSLTAFIGVIAAVVFSLFFWLYNFSISSQVAYALKKNFGDLSEEERTSGGSALGSRQGMFLHRVFSQAKISVPNTSNGQSEQQSLSGVQSRRATRREDPVANNLISALSAGFSAPLLGRTSQLDEDHDEDAHEMEANDATPWGDDNAFGPRVDTDFVSSPLSDATDRSTAALLGITIPPISRRSSTHTGMAVVNIPSETASLQNSGRPQQQQQQQPAATFVAPPRRAPLRASSSTNHSSVMTTPNCGPTDPSRTLVLSPSAEVTAVHLATDRVLDQLVDKGVI